MDSTHHAQNEQDVFEPWLHNLRQYTTDNLEHRQIFYSGKIIKKIGALIGIIYSQYCINTALTEIRINMTDLKKPKNQEAYYELYCRDASERLAELEELVGDQL